LPLKKLLVNRYLLSKFQSSHLGLFLKFCNRKIDWAEDQPINALRPSKL
jgi:hypothetical protein